MANPHDHPTAPKDLQDFIYRKKVLRARAMTPEERITSVFEMSDFQFNMMHSGAMQKIGSKDSEAGNPLGRSKDLDDARDVLAVQDSATLDMAYVRPWCDTHGTASRLDDILASLPPL